MFFLSISHFLDYFFLPLKFPAIVFLIYVTVTGVCEGKNNVMFIAFRSACKYILNMIKW